MAGHIEVQDLPPSVFVFAFFGIPAIYQHRVLFYGIMGALVFRAMFIAMGSVLLQYHWVIWVFGAFLILTGIKMMFAPERSVDPEKNLLIHLFRRFVPVTPELHGQRFIVRLKGVLFIPWRRGNTAFPRGTSPCCPSAGWCDWSVCRRSRRRSYGWRWRVRQ